MKSNAALLWDESYLWGLMAYKALRLNNLQFDLIRSQDIKAGALKNYKLLFVPGGWASNKLKSLGNEGIAAIKEFVNNGGNYLGFCGGAGLATLDGIGLLDIKRRPTKERVPSFSGRINLNINDHPIFQTTSAFIFHAWWPSQFVVADGNIKVLARYADAMPDSFSSDLNVGDVEANGNWQELENLYWINLDPKRLLNEPAVVEGTFGKGKVILSLVHFDTPEDENGAMVLKSLWEYLTEQQSDRETAQQAAALSLCKAIEELEPAVDDLISLGMRNFLWFWRNPMLLQWRRGVRGLEYCTLYIMIKELSDFSSRLSAEDGDKLQEIKKLFLPFIDKASRLLIMERLAMQSWHITYEKCDDPEIQKIRTELFGNSKSHGGMFKRLIDEIDSLLYKLLK
jgi:glutamine amidotransferase-like uncharacterized protein